MKTVDRSFLSLLLLWLVAIGNAHAQEKPTRVSFSTGFLVSHDGYVVTAHHAIKGWSQVLVGPDSGNRFVVAEVVRVDEKKDLALLKTRLTGKALRIAPWSEVPIGLEVYAVGYPQVRYQGFSRKITQGIINGDRSGTGDTGYFQFSAQVQQGNSGGPLLAPDGSVIGVAIRKLNALSVAEKTRDLPQNVNYGIKSSTLLTFLKESGVHIESGTLNLRANQRAYEVYRQTSGSVLAVIARNSTGPQPANFQIVPKP